VSGEFADLLAVEFPAPKPEPFVNSPSLGQKFPPIPAKFARFMPLSTAPKFVRSDFGD
jgi:hypothetical protein